MALGQEELQEMFEKNGGDISDDQMAAMLSGEDLELGDKDADVPTSDQGDDTVEAKSPEDAASPEEEPSEDALDSKDDADAGDAKDKVIVAKDGVHTISYDKLVEARDAAKANKAEAETLRSLVDAKDKLLEELQNKSGDDVTAKDEAETETAVNLLADLDELAEDYPEAAKGIKVLLESNKTLAEKVEALGELVQNTTETVTKTTAETAADKHFDAIREKHADFAEVVASDKFNAWVESQPKFLQKAYNEVLETGTAADVIEMLDNFKPTVAADDKADKGADKDKAVDDKIKAAQEKSLTPSSLSDIPAGSQGEHDAGERLRSSNAIDLIDAFSGKSQEQIEALLEKAL